MTNCLSKAHYIREYLHKELAGGYDLEIGLFRDG